MEQPSLPISNDRTETIQQVSAAAQARADRLKCDAEAAARESAIWQDLLSYQHKSWWFHIRSLFEREAEFFRRLRETQSPVIGQLESLYREAKNHTEELILQLPRDIERMAQVHNLPLDLTRSRQTETLPLK